MRKVEVCSYNEDWALMYEKEVKILKHALGKNILEIHHIGSTSIPGLKAKPIIDIMPVVRDINLVDYHNDEMRALGYEPKGEYGIVGRRYFPKGEEKRTHHVHVFQEESVDIKRHLAFRNYLRTHGKVSNSYGELKEKLAKQFPYDIDGYINGKNQLVKEIEGKALKWFKEYNKK